MMDVHIVMGKPARLPVEGGRVGTLTAGGRGVAFRSVPVSARLLGPPYANSVRAPVLVRSSGDAQFMYAIAALDTAPEWTLDQIAGLVFGGFLVALYFSSKFIDDYVAVSQRRQLGLCEKCGGLYDKASCVQKECPARGKL